MSKCSIIVNGVRVPVSISSFSDFVNSLKNRFECNPSFLSSESDLDDDCITVSWRVDGVLVALCIIDV